VKERVVTFGPERNLVGVLTQPDQAGRNLPALVFLNAGLLHRVGPYRMHVDLARRLAARGYPSLRFDLAGRGDSARASTGTDDPDAPLADIRHALDMLEEGGHGTHFVLFGLCTGADHAHRGAVLDPRVTGTIMLDGYGYRTWKFFVRRYAPALLSPARLLRSISSRLGNILSHAREPAGDGPRPDQDEEFLWRLPAKADFAGDLRALVQRETRMLYIYTAGVSSDYYNYQDQFRDAFPDIDFRGCLQVQMFPDADHEFTLLEDRARMFDTITGWLDRNFMS